MFFPRLLSGFHDVRFFCHNVHSLLWTQDRGAALTLTTHHGTKEEDTESPQGEVCAQSHPDPTSSRSQSQLQQTLLRWLWLLGPGWNLEVSILFWAQGFSHLPAG